MKSTVRRLSCLSIILAAVSILGAAALDFKNDGFAADSTVATPDQTTNDPMPQEQSRRYVAISAHTPELLGDLDLSRTSASFSKLKGAMELEYSGSRTGDGPADWEFTGAVFRIVNAEAFFSANRGKNGFCHSPARWLTILDLNNRLSSYRHSAPSIRVGILTIQDWHDYKPTDFGACSADTFILQPAN